VIKVYAPAVDSVRPGFVSVKPDAIIDTSVDVVRSFMVGRTSAASPSFLSLWRSGKYLSPQLHSIETLTIDFTVLLPDEYYSAGSVNSLS